MSAPPQSIDEDDHRGPPQQPQRHQRNEPRRHNSSQQHHQRHQQQHVQPQLPPPLHHHLLQAHMLAQGHFQQLHHAAALPLRMAPVGSAQQQPIATAFGGMLPMQLPMHHHHLHHHYQQQVQGLPPPMFGFPPQGFPQLHPGGAAAATPPTSGEKTAQQQKQQLPPPPPRQQPDEALISQFLERYALQADHTEINVSQVVGTLNVDDCLAVIEENDITFVVTDTGTGKSSLVPDALIKKDGVRVANSQPRRQAAISLAQRVSDLRHEKVGTNVGYWVRGEHLGDVEKCKLMYMTSYTLLLYIISHPTSIGFTHVIIDEFHERQPDVEVMLALLKLALTRKNDQSSASNNRSSFKFVLMSASVELELWKQYFSGLKVGEYSTCKPRYPIHDYFMEDVCRLVGLSFNKEIMAEPSGKIDRVPSLAFQQVKILIQKMLELLAKHANPQDSILVFLPGRTVVEDMKRWIQQNFSNQLDPIAWYRDIDLNVIQAALRRTATTKKKVYLATDIAEVSLTLPDVVFIIDSGTTKKPRIDPNHRNSVAFPPLELLWCSRSAVTQRRGRVGRVQQGFYLTLIPESMLPDLPEMEPQIANSTIHELSLHILQLSANPLLVYNLCRVTPKTASVQFSVSILSEGGFILPDTHPLAAEERMIAQDSAAWTAMLQEGVEQQCGHDAANVGMFSVTVKGVIAQRLPVTIECGSMVYLGLLFGLETPMILAAAIVGIGTPFYAALPVDTNQTYRDRQKVQRIVDNVSQRMKDYSQGVLSDLASALVVTAEFKVEQHSGLSESGLEEWCKERSVSRSRLHDIVRLETQIREQLAAQIPFSHLEDPSDLLDSIASNAQLISDLASAAHLERALFVENDRREQQRKKSVGPSIFIGIAAMADTTVATCCPWSVGHIVLPLSMQTRYDHLLGAFAIEHSQQHFNILLLLLVPKLVVEHRLPTEAEPGKVLFGVQLYGQKLCMVCDETTGKDVLLFRELLSLKLSVVRKQMGEKLSPNEKALNEHMLKRVSNPNLLKKITTHQGLSEMLRFALGSLTKDPVDPSYDDGKAAQRQEQGPHRLCQPCGPGELTPTQVSLVTSTGKCLLPFTEHFAVKKLPVEPEPKSPEVVAHVFVEDDDDAE